MKRMATVILAMVTFSLALSAAAKEKRYELQLPTAVEANGAQLKAGTYEVAVADSSLLFYQNSKEVAKLPVHVEHLGTKNQQTSVSTTQDRLTEIRLSGTNMKVEVEGSAQARK